MLRSAIRTLAVCFAVLGAFPLPAQSATWSEPELLGAGSRAYNLPQIDFSTDGHAFALWNDGQTQYASTRSVGHAWQQPVTFEVGPASIFGVERDRAVIAVETLGVDPERNSEQLWPTGFQTRDIDSSLRLGSPVTVAQHEPDNGLPSGLAVERSGFGVAVWTSKRAVDPATGLPSRSIYAARRTPAGSFGAPFLVRRSVGSFPALAASVNRRGDIAFAWTGGGGAFVRVDKRGARPGKPRRIVPAHLEPTALALDSKRRLTLVGRRQLEGEDDVGEPLTELVVVQADSRGRFGRVRRLGGHDTFVYGMRGAGDEVLVAYGPNTWPSGSRRFRYAIFGTGKPVLEELSLPRPMGLDGLDLLPDGTAAMLFAYDESDQQAAAVSLRSPGRRFRTPMLVANGRFKPFFSNIRLNPRTRRPAVIGLTNEGPSGRGPLFPKEGVRVTELVD